MSSLSLGLPSPACRSRGESLCPSLQGKLSGQAMLGSILHYWAQTAVPSGWDRPEGNLEVTRQTSSRLPRQAL